MHVQTFDYIVVDFKSVVKIVIFKLMRPIHWSGKTGSWIPLIIDLMWTARHYPYKVSQKGEQLTN